jgi:hypothetical protein
MRRSALSVWQVSTPPREDAESQCYRLMSEEVGEMSNNTEGRRGWPILVVVLIVLIGVTLLLTST